jgi:glycosyltransferase involved in cell wall biosynthesis
MRNDLDVRCVPALRRLIRRTAYDIVHFHTKRAHALALWMPRGRQRPRYVVTRRMDYAEPRTWYTRHLYNRRVDGVVAISRSIVDVLVAAGVERGNIRWIPSGIEPGRFAAVQPRRDSPGKTTVIGSLAALETRKGQQYLLEAAALLKARGLRLEYRIAGEGPLRETLEAESRRLGLGADVRFVGFVGDPAEFLSGIDIFAMPSLHEGLGVAVLEAMAAGKPVVAARVGGLAESVLDGVTGILIPARDPDALARALAQLAQSRDMAQSMGRRGRERAQDVFSLENTAAQNELYYRELLAVSN